MRKDLFLLGFLILIMTECSLAAEEVGISVHLNNIPSNQLQSETCFHEINGEIVSIDADVLTIAKAGVYFELKLAPQIKIYCNGLAASWRALKPITRDAFFETRAILNKQNQVVLLEGYYQGEECIIQGWQGNEEQFYLKLMSVNNLQNKQKLLKSDATLPKENWLVLGQLVYVLYNREGKVRGVYLPD